MYLTHLLTHKSHTIFYWLLPPASCLPPPPRYFWSPFACFDSLLQGIVPSEIIWYFYELMSCSSKLITAWCQPSQTWSTSFTVKGSLKYIILQLLSTLHSESGDVIARRGCVLNLSRNLSFRSSLDLASQPLIVNNLTFQLVPRKCT